MLPYIIGIVVGAILVFFKNKYTNAMVLLKNLLTKEQLLDKDAEKLKNDNEIDKVKKEIQELHNKYREGKVSDEDLAKWFNDYFDTDIK